ncbi:MAG: hypothetical protein NTW74_11745 [Acidobacteria bacterium]|nr:hypothetical protein [Acidobacteriota bacterium]
MKQKVLLLSLAALIPLYSQMGQTGAGGGMGGFGGPAVLGSGAGSGTGKRGGSDLGISFFAGATGTYDSGLTGFALDSNGKINNSIAAGVDGFAGVYGSKRLRRGSVGINYSGHYRNYPAQGSFNGTDQTLGLYTNRQLSKRSTLSFFASAMTTNRAFGNSFAGASYDPTLGSIFSPNGEVFDNRVYFGSGNLDYSYQKSARLSFSVSGNGFITRRTGRVLFGVNGTSTNAMVSYRLSRRQTISAGHQFFMFNFTRNFGDSYGNGAFGGYSVQLGKRAQMSLQGGFIRLESLGLTSTAVDPVIAALIGVSTVQEVFYSKSIMPTAQATLSYRVNRLHSLSFNGGIAATPGNGIINTSRSTFGGANYSYSGILNLGLGANVSFNRLASLIGSNQVFETVQSSVNANRRLSNQLFFTVTAGNRKFLGSSTNGFKRNSYQVSAGFTWSPREIPVSIR